MSDDASARFALPLLRAGQAQKELTHNEALTLADLLMQASVVAVGVDTPPAAPEPGDCWIVGATPSGVWAGHAHAFAGWTAGGWRFAIPREGLTVWSGADTAYAVFSGGSWAVGALCGARVMLGGQQVIGPRGAAVPDSAGGSVVDVEARATLAALLVRLRTHGLIES